MKKIKIGIIGLGQRGQVLIKDEILKMDDVDIIAVCDEYEDRASEMSKIIKEKTVRRCCAQQIIMNYLQSVKLRRLL